MPRGLNTDIWAPRVPNASPSSASVSSAQAGRYSFTDSARTPKFTKNEAGESELLLGNHHLVALFIIIVCLVGILFTTGYIAGGRSSPVSVAKVASENKRETRPPIRSSVHEATRTSEQPSAALVQQRDIGRSPHLLEVGGWLQSYEALSHPATTGIGDERNQRA